MYNHTDEQKKQLFDIVLKHQYQMGNQIWVNWELVTKACNELFDVYDDKEKWRSRYRTNKHRFTDEGEIIAPTVDERLKTWHQVKLTFTEDEYGCIDDALIIQKMGFNQNKWKLQDVIASKWWTENADAETLYHGQLKVKLVPKIELINMDWLEAHLQNVKPNIVDVEYYDVETLLFIPFNDMHWGVMEYADYYETMQRALQIITQKHRDKIVFVIGGDLIHNNDLKGHTANGTLIEQVNMNKAIEDAVAFFSALIEKALKNCNEVTLTWNKGNHDEMISMLIARELRALFPQCLLDIEDTQYKLINYGNNAIGYTHGDIVGRSAKETMLHNGYMHLYRDRFTVDHNRYILTEHYHKKELVDEWGTYVYTLATKKKDDRWHTDNMYIGSKKDFSLFEFDKERLINTFKV